MKLNSILLSTAINMAMLAGAFGPISGELTGSHVALARGGNGGAAGGGGRGGRASAGSGMAAGSQAAGHANSGDHNGMGQANHESRSSCGGGNGQYTGPGSAYTGC